LVLGITFKENCPDIRNSRVIDVIEELKSYGCNVEVYDPWADAHEVKEEYNVDLVKNIWPGTYEAVVVAVAHNEFKEIDVVSLKNKAGIIFDIKAIVDKTLVDGRL
jgi:UDP-N-acetyl-D-glucosamine/UDP-N-acetyl-D-galactosamine dehydrogenase